VTYQDARVGETGGEVRQHEDGPAADRLHAWETGLAAERPRLVRLCARITGSADAAEDLAQDTLVEAWRRLHKVYDEAGWDKWLSAIARNVCLRWLRDHGRDLAHLQNVDAHRDDDGGSRAATMENMADNTADVELELDREGLARLLDRALALLPPLTRRVLIESYIEETPQAEVAARLGVSEDAVAMRLQRGRLTLRRVLAGDLGDLGDEAAAYGLVIPGSTRWQETRIWCPRCGVQRLVGLFDTASAEPEVTLRCPGCCVEPGLHISHARGADILGSVKGFKPALSRIESWAHRFYQPGLVRGAITCPYCSHISPLLSHLPASDDVPPSVQGARGAYVRCHGCGILCWSLLRGLALCTPEARRFWRDHPRIRTLPEREVEAGANGRPVLITRFEDVTGAASLAVIADRETYEVIRIDGPTS